MKGKRVLAILTSLVLTVGTLSVGAYAADGGSASATTGKTAAAAAEDPCADGHDYVVKETVEPTCEKEGSTVYVCTRCGDTKTVKVDALDHDYQVTETVAPTCEEGGYTVYTCTRCGDSYTDDETKALGHKYEVTRTVEPTCTKKGSVTYTCSNCGDSYKDETDALGHDFSGEPRITKEATAEAEGELTYYCTHDGCRETKVEKIPKLETEDKKDASKLITEEGETETVREEAKKGAVSTAVFRVNGVDVEGESGAIAGTDSKASFKKEGDGYTLTLEGATLAYTASSASEETPPAAVIEYTGSDPLKISVKGENKITYSGTAAFAGAGIVAADAAVTIEGTGAEEDALIITTGNGTALYAKSVEIKDPLGVVSPEEGEIGDITVSEKKYKGILKEEAVAPDVTVKTVTYTVKYDGNGGSGAMKSGSVLKGDKYTLEKNTFTEPDGQEFEAWIFDGKEYGEEDEIAVTEDTTVKAKWKEKEAVICTVTYSAGDGKGAMPKRTYEKDTKINLPVSTFEAPEGKEFSGWEIDGKTYEEKAEYTVTGDVTVTAQWEKKKESTTKDCYLSFEPGEGSGKMDPVKMTYKYDDVNKRYSYTVTLPECTFTAPEGKVFDKWKIGKNTFDAKTALRGFTSDSTATALWKDKGEETVTETDSYTITYDKGEGTGSMASDTVDEGKEFKLPECKFTSPSEDKCFDKWQIGDKTYAVGESVSITKDTTVTALWKAHEWGEIEYTWSTDNATCSARSKCKDCGHEATEQATVTKTSTATCEADGTATYTAKFTGNTSWNTEKKVEEKALGHDWQEPKIEWTDSTHAKATMTCSRDSSHTRTEDAKVTGSATLPTTTENGTVKYTATVTINGKEYTDTREEAVEPAGTNKGYKFTVKPDSWTKRTTTTTTNTTTTTTSANTSTAGSNYLRFTIKRDKFDVLTYSAFTSGGSVQIDGKTVENKNNSCYTTAKGSLILTFTPAYLSTLSAGSHTLKVNFKDGSVDTKFTVKGTTAAATTNRTTNAVTNRTTGSPRTGDYSNWALWIGLIAVSVIGIGAIVFSRKRGKKSE